jgi:hypothetical protein
VKIKRFFVVDVRGKTGKGWMKRVPLGVGLYNALHRGEKPMM